MPDAAITTDIIVGFPGETEQDFSETLDVVRQARFAGAFTFQYSTAPRHAGRDDGRPGAARGGAERYERLVALVGEVTLAENQRLVGTRVEVLVAEGEGRKDDATHRMSGRARDNRLVHFTPQDSAPRPGDVVTVTVTRAAPHYLIADGAPWRSGAPAAATRGSPARAGAGHRRAVLGTPGESGASWPGPVALGMPRCPAPSDARGP